MKLQMKTFVQKTLNQTSADEICAKLEVSVTLRKDSNGEPCILLNDAENGVVIGIGERNLSLTSCKSV